MSPECNSMAVIVGLFVIFAQNDKIKAALCFKFSKAPNLSSAISAQNAVDAPLFCTKKQNRVNTFLFLSGEYQQRESGGCDSRLVALQPALAFRTWTTVAFLGPLSVQLLVTKPVC